MQIILLLSLLLVMLPQTAHAYIGPGLGMGVVGVILGVIFSIVLAIFGIFWYPLKRVYKKIRTNDKPAS
ncbi:hypothetical protein [Desulfosediminicola sp.]|uniref:hypothetical protein n=1 Tax=Desulfosediminicola sp. TaxID=2886825 RepID=UPI003AF23F14